MCAGLGKKPPGWVGTPMPPTPHQPRAWMQANAHRAQTTAVLALDYVCIPQSVRSLESETKMDEPLLTGGRPSSEEEYNILSAHHDTFSKIDKITGQKTDLIRYKLIEIIPCILSDHDAIRVIFNSNKKQLKTKYTFKLNSALLNET